MAESLPLGASGLTARDVVVQTAYAAGETIRQRFGNDHSIEFKGRANVVTDTDRLVEQQVVEALLREFPNFGVLAEESGRQESASPYVWVVDPVDGTRNYAAGIPHFCTVIALAYQGKVVLGATYDPMRNEMFLAQNGQGATLNGKPVVVSGTQTLPDAIISFDMGYRDDLAGYALDMVQKLWPGIQGFRTMGSAALGMAYAATGRTDLYFHHNLAPWDIAAGLVLAQETGATVTDKQGNPAGLYTEGLVVSNPTLHRAFLTFAHGSAWHQA